jgi:hypothetical protein
VGEVKKKNGKVIKKKGLIRTTLEYLDYYLKKMEKMKGKEK